MPSCAYEVRLGSAAETSVLGEMGAFGSFSAAEVQLKLSYLKQVTWRQFGTPLMRVRVSQENRQRSECIEVK